MKEQVLAILRAINDPEILSEMADLYKNMLDSFMAKGFSREEAISFLVQQSGSLTASK